ncbi:MAG: hypothetical protein ACKOBM_10105 [Gammaproteobacteria bacterium]
MAAAFEAAGFTVDYVATVDQRRFGAVVVQCGTRSVRLIDNVPLGNITQMAPATAPEQSAP